MRIGKNLGGALLAAAIIGSIVALGLYGRKRTADAAAKQAQPPSPAPAPPKV